MIPNVIGLGAELGPSLLIHWKSLKEAHVPVLKSRLMNDVANKLRVEGTGRRRGKPGRSIGIRRCKAEGMHGSLKAIEFRQG